MSEDTPPIDPRRVPTPNLDKMLEVQSQSQPLGEFLEWLMAESDWSIHTHTGSVLDDRHIESILASYFRVSLQGMEDERRALIGSLRERTRVSNVLKRRAVHRG